MDLSTTRDHVGEEREGGARLCGEPHACAWQWLHHEASPAHARPHAMMVARLWKKYAARRTVNILALSAPPFYLFITAEKGRSSEGKGEGKKGKCTFLFFI